MRAYGLEFQLQPHVSPGRAKRSSACLVSRTNTFPSRLDYQLLRPSTSPSATQLFLPYELAQEKKASWSQGEHLIVHHVESLYNPDHESTFGNGASMVGSQGWHSTYRNYQTFRSPLICVSLQLFALSYYLDFGLIRLAFSPGCRMPRCRCTQRESNHNRPSRNTLWVWFLWGLSALYRQW